MLIIFRVIGGDVYEVPVPNGSCGFDTYDAALAFVLDWFGYDRNDVIVCVSANTKGSRYVWTHS